MLVQSFRQGGGTLATALLRAGAGMMIPLTLDGDIPTWDGIEAASTEARACLGQQCGGGELPHATCGAMVLAAVPSTGSPLQEQFEGMV
jgi:hypothetical protein